MDTMYQLLEEAANLIEREGWRQPGGTKFWHADGKHCVYTACFQALLDSLPPHFQQRRLLTARAATLLHETMITFAATANVPVIGRLDDIARNIWDWNDAPTQTKNNVLSMMRAAAAVDRARYGVCSANYTTPVRETV